MSRTGPARRVVEQVRRRRQSSKAWLDRFYAAEYDPYHFDANDYEAGKFGDLLGVLAARRYSRALEVGCSIGSFTERLAPHCDHLLAIDIAEAAVERARARVAGLPQVKVEQRAVPGQLPPGPYDLVVCSDVLYFLPLRRLRRTLDQLAGMLAPGGSIVSLHWRGDLGAPTSGDAVHDEQKRAWSHLVHVASHVRTDVGPAAAGYRLDRFDAMA